MLREDTFQITGMFKVLSESEKDITEKVGAIKYSLEKTLNDLEMRGIINNLDRTWNGSGSWVFNFEKVKK
jgi:hypothetical protein